jgi:hypothetical protein
VNASAAIPAPRKWVKTRPRISPIIRLTRIPEPTTKMSLEAASRRAFCDADPSGLCGPLQSTSTGDEEAPAPTSGITFLNGIGR